MTRIFLGLVRGGLGDALQVLAVVGGGVHQLVGDRQRVRLVVGVAHGLEALLGVDALGREDEGGGHQEARGRVGIADAEVQRLVALEHVVEALERAVLVHDDVGVVAVLAVGGDGLGEHLALGAIDRLHRRLVAEPGDLHLLEAHALDHAGVVGGEEGVDLQAGALLHVGQEGIPDLLEVGGRFRRDDAEVDLLGGACRGGSHRYGDRCRHQCAKHAWTPCLLLGFAQCLPGLAPDRVAGTGRVRPAPLQSAWGARRVGDRCGCRRRWRVAAAGSTVPGSTSSSLSAP